MKFLSQTPVAVAMNLLVSVFLEIFSLFFLDLRFYPLTFNIF